MPNNLINRLKYYVLQLGDPIPDPIPHQGDAKLADFGMAVVVPPGARLMESVGSPHYACPQIIMGQRYNGYNADVWSLGVFLPRPNPHPFMPIAPHRCPCLDILFAHGL